MINCFDKEYAFLSNFFDSEIVDEDGICYPTVEHYFQAMKTLDKVVRFDIAISTTPGQAKRKGRKVSLRPDWEQVKEQVMYDAIVQKFANEELREKLLATGDEYLEEGTTWHDNEWGNCSCEKCQKIVGKNKLGKILMQVRSEIRDGKC